jgi:sigma-E factor negative regulatory protein RseC
LATEQGVVLRTDSEAAWVKTVRSSACEDCTARGSCHTTGGGQDMEVKAINTAGASVGDRIVLSFETASLLKATFLIYVFPIILMFIIKARANKMAKKNAYQPKITKILT